MVKYKIFDVHTHVYPDMVAEKAVSALERFYDFKCEGNGRFDDLIKSEREAGIDGFLLLGVATNVHQVERVNTAIADNVRIARELGFESYGFAGMHQDFDDIEAEGERIISLGLSGFKIHPDIQGVDIDDPRLFPLYAFCEGRCPIYFHIGDNRERYRYSKLNRLYRVAEKFPDLRFAAAHLGGYLDHELALSLSGHKNMWYDCSSSLWNMTESDALALFEHLGYDRIMFGTDYPCKFGKDELKRFFSLGLDMKTNRDILWDNAMNFLCKSELHKN